MEKTTKKQSRGCECCVYYDFNEETGQYECRLSLDEDEMSSFLSGNTGECRFFNFYDEYSVVKKQN